MFTMFPSFFLGIVLAINPLALREMTSPAQESAKAAPAASSSVATTQPASTSKDAETIGEIFGRTRVGQLFEGKRQVTLADARNPLFWLETVRDLILAAIAF